jgi:hypothetical protein
MRADARIDVFFFDVTNNFIYLESFQARCQAISDVQVQGGTTPQVAYLTPFISTVQTVQYLYNNIYKIKYHSELWFMCEEKPFMLDNP